MSKLALITDSVNNALDSLRDLNEALIVVIADNSNVSMKLGFKPDMVKNAVAVIRNFVAKLKIDLETSDRTSPYYFICTILKNDKQPLTEWQEALNQMVLKLETMKALDKEDINLLERILSLSENYINKSLSQLRNL